MWLIGFVGSKLGRLVAGALAVLATIGLAFKMGQRDQKKEQQIEDLKDYKKAREDVDAVDTALDRDARIERLRKHNNIRED